MNLNMEVLKSADLENLIKSIDIELRHINALWMREDDRAVRLNQLTLKKKLLKDEIAHRILLGEIE